MKEYDISIVETLTKMVTVKAESREEALEQVEREWGEQLHVLDADNFDCANFAVEEERDLTAPLQVLLVQPEKPPTRIELPPTLAAMQEAVGGSIQAVYAFPSVAIVCNDSGKLDDLPPNRALRDERGEAYDVICGDFFIAGVGEEDFCSLTEAQLTEFEQKYAQPEQFLETPYGVVVAPMQADREQRHRCDPKPSER